MIVLKKYIESARMSTGNDAIAVRWPTFSKALQANFRQLRLDNKLIDIIIAVENQQIPAHRLLLASCSKFFFELFESLITSIGNPTIRKCINNYLERARFEKKQQINVLDSNCSRFGRSAVR